MAGKRGLVMGVANDHSIAWGIASKLSEHGRGAATAMSKDWIGAAVIMAGSLAGVFIVTGLEKLCQWAMASSRPVDPPCR